MKKSLLYSFFITAMLCIAGINNAWGLDYTAVVTNVAVSQLNSITKNQFTVTITQDGWNNTSGSPYRGSTATLILESNDRTLEGTYKSTNSTNSNKINANSEATYGGNTGRMLRSDQESKLTINKTGNGSYAISSSNGWIGFKKSSTTYNYTYCFYYINVAKTEYALGNFNFSYTPESYCDAPTGLTRDGLTFSWTSSASTFQYCCLVSNVTTLTDEIWIANRQTTSSNSVTLEGLEPGGSYKFYVLAEGPGGTSTIVSSSAFTAPCDTKTAPWSENFDRDAMRSGYIPNCWDKKTTNYGSVKVVSSNAYSSSKCVQIYGGGTNEAIAIFPEFEEDIKDLAFSFWYKSAAEGYSHTYARLQPGYVLNDEFYPVGNPLEPSSSYVHVENFVINDAPQGASFALRYGDGSTVESAYIDDIEVTAKPANIRPTSITVSALSDDEATITWNTNGMSSWRVQTSDDGETWSEAVSVNTNTYTFTGLSASTTYYVRVKGYNNGESNATERTFKTNCASITTLPWEHNFDEDATVPEYWNTVGYHSDSYFQGNMPLIYSGDNAHGGNGKFMFSYGGGSSTKTFVILPPFEEATGNLAISFWYNNRVTNNTHGQTEIGYIIDPLDVSTYTTLTSLDRVGEWTFVNSYALTGAPDNARIAIRHAGGSYEYGYSDIDDITVDLIPVCHAPTAITASNITPSGATISWTAENEETAWKMQYSTDGENWTNVNNGNAIDSNPYALTGLSNANTLYYVRMKAVCDVEDESSWSSSISFKTDCDAISINASTPWEENFNEMSADIIPECWNNSASTTTSSWGANYIWGTYNAGSGNKMLRMSNGYLDGGIALINTPAFAIPDDGKEYEFMFDYANHASSDLIVKMSVDGSAFGVVNTYPNTGSNSTNPGELTSVRLSLYGHNGSTVKLQFYTEPASGYSSADGAMFVDNVGVRKVPSCFQPTALAASNLTVNNAHIAWTAGGTETSWKLQYRESAGEWSEEISVNTTAAKELESLSANTTYEVRVKAWCDIDDFSEWSETASFTTLCAAESMPYSEEFSQEFALPSCWEAAPATGVYRWSAYAPSYGYFNVQLRTGSSGTASLCTPPVDLSEDAILRFKWKNANGTAVNLYISTDRGETKTLISEELSDVQADWATKQYNLSAYTGEEAQFYFIATFSTQNQYAYLDDVEVLAVPTEIFEDVASATNNQTRLEALMGQTLNITINRPLLRNGDYCTLTLPFDLSAEQIADENCPLHGFTIKEFESSESGDAVNIYLTEVGAIEAGKPYFVRYAGTPTNERLTPLTFRNVTVAAYEPASIALTDDCTPHGVFNPYALVANDVTTLFLSSNNTLYYPSAYGTMNGFRAYIKVGDALSAPIRRGAPIRIVEKENTATGIDQITNDKSPMTNKILRDGQIIIIRDGKEYNVMGIMVK